MKGVSRTVLFMFLLALMVGASIGVSSRSTAYDPWADSDDDGDIDIFDIVYYAGMYGTTGVPYAAKAYLAYDSGWINFTTLQGQYVDVVHNLGVTDWNTQNITVEITGKADLGDDTLLRQLGLTSESHWSRTYGGVSYEYGRAIVQTSDGGYALAGGIMVQGGSTSHDFCLVKTASDGTVEFTCQYDGSGSESARTLVQTRDGGYALAGVTTAGAGGNDFWLVKTDASGTEEWNQTFGGVLFDEPEAVIQTRDGGFAIVGYTESLGSGGEDFWLVKTDQTGKLQWDQTYGGIDDDRGQALIETTDYGFALTGSTASFGQGANDAWLVVTYQNGTIDWTRTYGGVDGDGANSVVQTADGGYALAGHTNSFGSGSVDFWLVKTDSNGNAAWNRTYGSGATAEDAHSVVQTTDEGYALVGIVNHGALDFDCFLVKTDVNGTLEWSLTYGGSGWDDAWTVVHTTDGGYAVIGGTDSFDFDNIDIWLIKVGIESGLTWTASTQNTITLYKGATDLMWNYVRVRIWKVKGTP